jgi:hypothetical protein
MLPGPTAARRQLGRAIPAPTDTASPADATNAAGATNSASPTNSTGSADAAGSPNAAAYATDATRASNSTGSSNSSYSTGSSDPANAASAADVAAIPTARYRIRGARAAVDVVAVAAIDIRIAVEVIVVVDIDVVVAAPSTIPSPTTAPERAHHDANTKRDRHAGSVIPRWRIVDRRVGIDRRTVHHDRIISRYIHDLRIRLLDDDYTFAFDNLRLYFLLFIGFQIALLLRLLTHTLDGIHDVLLLCEECIA